HDSMTSSRLDRANVAPVRANATGGRKSAGCVKILVLVFCVAVSSKSLAAPVPKRPDFKTVAQATVGYFRTIPDFQRGDLISQQQVTGVLDAINGLGWSVPDRDKLVARALPDGSFLLQQSATSDGKKFMRKVAAQRGGYSYLDQLSRISDGEKMIRWL